MTAAWRTCDRYVNSRDDGFFVGKIAVRALGADRDAFECFAQALQWLVQPFNLPWPVSSPELKSMASISPFASVDPRVGDESELVCDKEAEAG